MTFLYLDCDVGYRVMYIVQLVEQYMRIGELWDPNKSTKLGSMRLCV